MQKNDEFELTITDIGNDGEGIGRYDGMTFFVNGAIPGDKIIAGATKLKKTYGYARIVRFVEESSNRVVPACAIAKRCGGCQLQHLSYEKQLEYKQKKVYEDLVRIGGIEPCEFEENIKFHDIIGMEEPVHYRNKGQFPVGCAFDGRVVSGFYAGHSHSIIETDRCLIQHPLTDVIMHTVKQFMDKAKIPAYDEEKAAKGSKNAGIVRHVLTRIGFTTHEVMVCLVINAQKLSQTELLAKMLNEAIERYNNQFDNELRYCELTGAGPGCDESKMGEQKRDYRLTSLTYNVNTENTNVILGNKCVTIFGNPYITDYIGNVKFQISPLSFFQVNPVQTVKLYSTALEYTGLTGNETVWDLYCGIGTISLFLAQKAKKVFGVEIVPQAIEDARVNAKLNNLDNAEFFTGAAEQVLPEMYKKDASVHADVIVVDPPRKGCDEKLLDCIAQLGPKKVVYVSCDPATLARDIKFLRAKGYELKEVRPCDMFPHSSHTETVCLLSKKP